MWWSWFYLCWYFELLNHSKLEETANATLDQVELGQWEVAEMKF